MCARLHMVAHGLQLIPGEIVTPRSCLRRFLPSHPMYPPHALPEKKSPRISSGALIKSTSIEVELKLHHVAVAAHAAHATWSAAHR